MFFMKNEYREGDQYHLKRIKHVICKIPVNTISIDSASYLNYAKRIVKIESIDVSIITTDS